jgi:hypothetical protein
VLKFQARRCTQTRNKIARYISYLIPGIFEIGKAYDIDYAEVPFDGRTLRNVKSATAVETSTAGLAASTAARQAPMGANHGGEFNRQTHPIDAERMFVCSILNAAIQSGKVTMEKQSLAQATMMLRGLWRYAFVYSEQNTFVSGAARVARG